MNSWRPVVIQVLLLIAALPLVGAGLLFAGFGLLGLLGVLADTSVSENRAFGAQFLLMSLFSGVPGIVLLSLAFVLGRRHVE